LVLLILLAILLVVVLVRMATGQSASPTQKDHSKPVRISEADLDSRPWGTRGQRAETGQYLDLERYAVGRCNPQNANDGSALHDPNIPARFPRMYRPVALQALDRKT
jgi:hypothetical protein